MSAGNCFELRSSGARSAPGCAPQDWLARAEESARNSCPVPEASPTGHSWAAELPAWPQTPGREAAAPAPLPPAAGREMAGIKGTGGLRGDPGAALPPRSKGRGVSSPRGPPGSPSTGGGVGMGSARLHFSHVIQPPAGLLACFSAAQAAP